MTTEVADQQFDNRVVDMGELQQAHEAELVRQDELAVKK